MSNARKADKVPTHTNNHFKPAEDKKTYQPKHERVPTTYPKGTLFDQPQDTSTTVDSDNLYNMSCKEMFRSLFCCGKK